MTKKHIVEFCGHCFYVESISAATDAVRILSKLKPARYISEGGYENWHYVPEDRELFLQSHVELKLNQKFREPRKAKEEKPLALPAPKRGSILCICERSYVAPKDTCPHCGRPFSESHNRTHDTTAKQSNLRLV